jgi:hypothetical protein
MYYSESILDDDVEMMENHYNLSKTFGEMKDQSVLRIWTQA